MFDSDSPTQWTKRSSNLTEQNYGIKLIFDEIDSAHSDLCFGNISKIHSLYKTTIIIVSIPKYKYSYDCTYHIISMIV